MIRARELARRDRRLPATRHASRPPTGARSRPSAGWSARTGCSCSSLLVSRPRARSSGSRSPPSRRRADTLTHPIVALPERRRLGQPAAGRGSTSHVGRYFWNTVVLAFGSWLCQIVVATTGGFVLSVLRPGMRGVLNALLLATLFVPAVVLLVPLYIEIVAPAADRPLVHRQLLGDLAARRRERVQRHAREALLRQPAARDLRGGADRRRRARSGCSSIVLPMSKPILGVVSVFAILASWKDFLWPFLVLSNPDQQPLSVRLPAIQSQTELGVFLAAMLDRVRSSRSSRS